METYTNECYNECGIAITSFNEGYYFRFYTRQDTFKDELCKASPTPKKFKMSYKDSDNKNSIIEGEAEYINIHDDVSPLYDSYVQVFLRDFEIHEGKREEAPKTFDTKIINNVDSITITTKYRTITWDDVSNVTLDTCTEEYRNEYGQTIRTATEYHFNFETKQLNFKKELEERSPATKSFKVSFKEDGKKFLLEGETDCVAITDSIYMPTNVSRIQVFLRDIKVHEDKREEIRQACCLTNLTNEEIKEMDKALITNSDVLKPLTINGGTMDTISSTYGVAVSSIYDPSVHINYDSIVIGENKFDTKELGAALGGLINKNKTEIKENKEDKTMFNKIFNKYKFGKLDTKDIAYSMNGIAFRTSDGSYVVYNNDLTFTNVDNLVMDIPVFVMPVPLSEIKSGDVIVHYGVGQTAFVIVDSINDTDIFISDPHTRERKNLIPEKSIFGFDFVAKVMTPNTMFAADKSNPFGNILPFMLMGEDANTDNLGLMMLLGQCDGEASWANQYLPLMLMGKGDNDMFKYMALMQMMNQNKETK